MSDFIETNINDDGIDRRGFLKCMAWAGTGVNAISSLLHLRSYHLLEGCDW
jgi:hypothetical protein